MIDDSTKGIYDHAVAAILQLVCIYTHTVHAHHVALVLYGTGTQ